jgi:hypothetical protein
LYDDENEYDDAPAAKTRTKTKTVNALVVRLIAAELLVNVAEPRLKIKGICHRHRYISLD